MITVICLNWSFSSDSTALRGKPYLLYRTAILRIIIISLQPNTANVIYDALDFTSVFGYALILNCVY
jgi:hypothetical protein